MKKQFGVMGLIIVILVIGCILFQLIPFGRNHTNPPVISEPQWDSPRTEELARKACFDCHSNETVWPWYSKIAPGSWLIYIDVVDGRHHLNFSDWNNSLILAAEAPEIVMEGEMPPVQYLLLHKDADLTTAEREELAQGLAATLSR